MAFMRNGLVLLSLTFTDVCLIMLSSLVSVGMVWGVKLAHDQVVEELLEREVRRQEHNQDLRSQREAWIRSMR